MTHDGQQVAEKVDAVATGQGLVPPDPSGASESASGDKRPIDLWMRVAVIGGGLFLLAAIGSFIGLNWGTLGSFMRVLTTLGIGACMFVCTLVLVSTGRWPFLVTASYQISGALQTVGLWVAFWEYFGLDSRLVIAISLLVTSVQALSVHVLWRPHPSLVFWAILATLNAVGLLFGLFDVQDYIASTILGLGLCLLSFLVIRDRYRMQAHFWMALGILVFYVHSFQWLSTVVTTNWQDMPQTLVAESVYLLVAGFGLYLGAKLDDKVVLIMSSLALLADISYLATKYFSDVIGIPLTLLIISLVFFALAFLLLHITRRSPPQGGSSVGEGAP